MRIPDIVDVGTGNIICPIIGGPFDGNYLSWDPKQGMERRFPEDGSLPKDFQKGVYRIGRMNGRHVWWWRIV